MMILDNVPVKRAAVAAPFEPGVSRLLDEAKIAALTPCGTGNAHAII